ncbi:hypothetical protein [Erwinia piriflorinigrans]|uniref:DUF8093 domain-containing protein n=1 Tax=Erwinia piriflorinigrans CFBP 5888 TaxID=1161919 RepID=V5ZDC7_9GAMM|nr:hypothetical protein [Erwinia piriflorinigrans]CCG89011.1 hypothetical protein EPIR_3648 [Erwinia piriflorinigrans CFBP 5888]
MNTCRENNESMKLIFFSFESTEPENFSRIINPANVRSELDRNYLFGGAAQM